MMRSKLSKLMSYHKGQLTRAKKKGPQAVVDACNAATADWEIHGYPDCWADWDRAAGDAETELKYGKK